VFHSGAARVVFDHIEKCRPVFFAPLKNNVPPDLFKFAPMESKKYWRALFMEQLTHYLTL
jgi:hypothetical protein